jgi:hypothetical protein
MGVVGLDGKPVVQQQTEKRKVELPTEMSDEDKRTLATIATLHAESLRLFEVASTSQAIKGLKPVDRPMVTINGVKRTMTDQELDANAQQALMLSGKMVVDYVGLVLAGMSRELAGREE